MPRFKVVYSKVSRRSSGSRPITAIKLGMAIRAFMLSERIHTVPVSRTVPRITPDPWQIAKIFQFMFPSRNSAHRPAYSPQPRMVARANRHRQAHKNADTHGPNPALRA